jgi:hypothetical protein
MKIINLKSLHAFIFGIIVVFFAASCNKDSEIGKSLIALDEIKVAFDDTLKVTGHTIAGQPVITYDASQTTKGNIYLLGKVNDPIFGKSEAEMYLQIEKLDTATPFKGQRLDSIVLVLPYDTTALYLWGDTLKQFSLEVRKLTDTLPSTAKVRDFYSNVSYPSGELLGSLNNFYPRPKTGSTEIDCNSIPGRCDTNAVNPSLRIRLDQAFGQTIMDLPDTVLNNISAFRRAMKGVHIKSVGNTDCILGFDFDLPVRDGAIRLYYTKNDTAKFSFILPLSYASPKTNYFKIDGSSAPIQQYIGNTSVDTILFIQGMSGPMAKIELPDLTTLNRNIINYAELELTVLDQSNDLALYQNKVPPQLMVYQKRGNQFEMVDDAFLSLSAGFSAFRYFGGYLIQNDSTGVKSFKINLSTYLQRVAKNQASRTIYISLFNEAENPRRLILAGPNHPKYPIKLKVAYTKL